VECDGVAWTMRGDLVDELLAACSTVIAGAGSRNAAQTIKTGPHRTVYRLSLPAGEFYLKHFRVADVKALLRNLTRPSRADLEWRAARNIARLGLPTFEPVAVGRVCRGGFVCDSFLVGREIPRTTPLDHLLSAELTGADPAKPPRETAHRQSELRQQLIVALGELAARLHRAGVEHCDFHAGNILVRLGQEGLPALWLIDLHKVHFRHGLSTRQRFRNLALLHQFFAGKSTRSDRRRFYCAYQQEWLRSAPPVEMPTERRSQRAAIARLERRLFEAAQAGWIRADRVWRRGNRHVRRRNSASASCRGLARLEATWLDGVRDDPERLFQDGLVKWHKQSAEHRVAEIRLPVGSSSGCATAFLKCVEPQTGWRQWLAPFRFSPLRRSWEFGHAFLRRGIDTPCPLLLIEQGNSTARRCYLLTEAVPESCALPQFFATQWPALSAAGRRDWLALHLARLAQQLQRLHESGFDHRDLKFSNLLVAADPADPRIWFLDLEGVRVWRPLPAFRRAQNLARINVSALLVGVPGHADRLRFLKWYLGDRFGKEWKWWWRRIAQLSQAKMASHRRLGRVLS
jgi:tRNA A-37 threonylcarbamoyl transferase component Bud32